MYIVNKAGVKKYVPPELEQYVVLQDVEILSISRELYEANERDEYGRKTPQGVVKEKVMTRFPDVDIDPEEEGDEDEVEEVVDREDVVPDGTWLKAELLEYIKEFKLSDEKTHVLERTNKKDLLKIINENKSKGKEA